MMRLLLAAALLASVGAGSPGLFAQAKGVELEEKLFEIIHRHQNGSSEAKEFEIEEAEANAYLREERGGALPEGVENPWVRFLASQAVVGATVDMEKLRAAVPDSMMLQLLTGRVPVEVTARIVGAKGVGKIEVERVLLGGVELPPALVAALIQGEAASKFLPPGFRLGEPFTLPYDLDAIRCRTGAVHLRQRPTTLDR